MRTFHIYTDASCKNTKLIDPINGIERTTKVGVIVVDCHIIDIYYNRKEKYFHSYYAERDAIKESIDYIKNQMFNVHNDYI